MEKQKNVREKLVELIDNFIYNVDLKRWYSEELDEKLADDLIAHGVTVQDDVTEMIGRGLGNIHWRIYGANKEFNERMAGYNPSAFCAGFEYAILLAKGLLAQLLQPPKGE